LGFFWWCLSFPYGLLVYCWSTVGQELAFALSKEEFMTLLYLCILWVFASAICAMLPIRLQYVPAVILLIAALILIIMIGIQINPWVAIAAVVAFLSMFRNPLRFIWAKLRGQNPQLPPEMYK
jgi:hypothetical protein